ncbi:MAG: FAD-binding oxidoreductase [Gammaproteobacteria bacterium]
MRLDRQRASRPGVSGINTALLDDLRVQLGSDAVLTDAADRWAYGVDNSRRQTLPCAVLLPQNQESVADILRLCHRYETPVTVRGRGTGTAGAAVPEEDGIVLSTERMNRILRVDAANRVAVVETGVTNDQLQVAAGEQGFFWPPDPTSAAYCSIGGNLGCNSAGPRAVKYGTPRENTLGLKAVTGEGDCLTTGCYTTKGVVGYDLTRLLIGSEGTLAVITEATLKLTPLPEAVITMRAIYRDIESAAAAVSAIMAQPLVPRVLEFMDGSSIQMIRGYDGDNLPKDAGAMLIIEADGDVPSLARSADILESAAGNPGLVEFRKAADAREAAQLWSCRKALSPALRQVAPGKINEDVVVPVSKMAQFVERLERLSRDYDVRIVNFGHAGNGNIHVNLLGNTADPEIRSTMERCLSEIFRTVLELGGTLSGEHGIGYDKREFVGLEIDAVTLDLMRRIKHQFDPKDILNPGKLFPESATPT